MSVAVSTPVHRLGSQNNIARPTTRALRAQGTPEAVGRGSISCRCFVLSEGLDREGIWMTGWVNAHPELPTTSDECRQSWDHKQSRAPVSCSVSLKKKKLSPAANSACLAVFCQHGLTSEHSPPFFLHGA